MCVCKANERVVQYSFHVDACSKRHGNVLFSRQKRAYCYNNMLCDSSLLTSKAYVPDKETKIRRHDVKYTCENSHPFSRPFSPCEQNYNIFTHTYFTHDHSPTPKKHVHAYVRPNRNVGHKLKITFPLLNKYICTNLQQVVCIPKY